MIPSIYVRCESLAEAWEKSIVLAYQKGMNIPTQYDREGDPNSRDVEALIIVEKPFSEPRYHRNFPGGFYDLEKYVAEVCDGVLDHQIDLSNSQKWHYTYHERLESYHHDDSVWQRPEPTVGGEHYVVEPTVVDQLSKVLGLLSECTYTRRAQAITWQPWKDLSDPECPCLQRMWFRVVDDHLCMSIDIRSNDAYKAAFMNMYAFTYLQARMAKRLSERLDREIKVGSYSHHANSYHLYGSYMIQEGEDGQVILGAPGEVQKFLLSIDDIRPHSEVHASLVDQYREFLPEKLVTRKWEDRVWTTEQANGFGLREERQRVISDFNLPESWPL